MVENTKQVRVDNWGIFFLQRLQTFFSKTDYCDLTLQFEGNVQLKVHRLVMNACTEYFTFLEQAYPAMEEGTILMPNDLQSDVIVPIVNFMYTGMLEFHVSIFEKLYKAAEIMNITVLMKLLDAQKTHPFRIQKKRDRDFLGPKKTSTPKLTTPELPPTLPGRKIPVWKRTSIPQHPITQLFCPDKNNMDPLMIPDNAPKPSRFEWPDDDLIHLNPLESTFENISYTSKPLLTQEEEQRAVPAASTSSEHEKRGMVNDMEKESDSQVSLFGSEDFMEIGHKRKQSQSSSKPSPKRAKNNDKENKETTISVKSNTLELDHTKIVTEILKKYPNLVKKNKNIKLKIMPMSPTKSAPETKVQNSTEVVPKKIIQVEAPPPPEKPEKPPTKKTKLKREESNHAGPWLCHKCGEGEPQEFVLYYLYRKHMTDIHHELFDVKLCKYCGVKCSNHHMMTYHLYTKHGMRPHQSIVFPQCDRCPFIGFSDATLAIHKQNHNSEEVQCLQCKLGFTNASTLTSHHQITSHMNRQGKHTYDCQYCTKRLPSSIDLLSHIRNSHLKEGRRDGIVCLDEIDKAEEEYEQEEEPEEILGGGEVPIPKDKVKIISNVKVPNSKKQAVGSMQQEIIPIQTGSENLNDVTGSIATNLGLVDIVVLDENQQYILQDNQTEQTEFILPELTSGENPFSGQVITTQHSTIIPQGVLQTTETDIGSADELVMVLTDHDYQDEQEGDNTNNSNIVVLYSHPVDGQGQFITSQGNLLVNSQTGMLEIRDGVIETTSANQIVVNDEGPIESIEMIQKEIESQNTLKQEPQEAYFEEDRKPVIHPTEDTVVINETIPEETIEERDEESGDRFVEEDERHEQSEEVQNVIEENGEDETPDQSTEEIEEQRESEGAKKNEEEHPTEEQHEDQNLEKCAQDFVDGPQAEPMEIEEQTEMDMNIQNQSEDHEDKDGGDQSVVLNNVDNIHHDEGEDVPPDSKDTSLENDTSLEDGEETEVVEEQTMKVTETEDAAQTETEENGCVGEDLEEPMEVDGKVNEEVNLNVEERGRDNAEKDESVVEEKESVKDKETAEESENAEENIEGCEESNVVPDSAELEEQDVESKTTDEDSVFQDSTKSQETSKSTNSSNIDKTILEDWEEDTDSQHSERQKEKGSVNKEVEQEEDEQGDKERSAVEVNKLMDDWEEEDEEK